MYDPVKDGVAKTAESVVYIEQPPAAALRDVVHCFWQLRTEEDLAEGFTLHALPDACVNVLFDQRDPRVAGVTLLNTRHVSLDLGRSFHYAGIQLYPGVWRGDLADTVDRYVGEPYEGDLPLVEVGMAAAAVDFDGKVEIFSAFVDAMIGTGVVAANPMTAAILANLDRIHDVSDMASIAGLSPRQLQRTLKQTTGLTPHDLWKVLRVQRAFRRDHHLHFADQSHFIRSFRHLTGYTPGRFEKTFHVRDLQYPRRVMPLGDRDGGTGPPG